MIVVMILHDLCDSNNSCSHTFTKVDYLRGLITLESLVVICLVVSYILILTDHHNKQLPPDVLREDLTSSIMQNTSQDDVIGCLEPDQMMEVLERQAEMIRYKRINNTQLEHTHFYNSLTISDIYTNTLKIWEERFSCLQVN